MFVTKEQMNGVVDLFQLMENNSGAISHKGYLTAFDNIKTNFIRHIKKLDIEDFTQNLTKSERTIKCEVKWMSCPSTTIPSYPISSNISIVLLPIYKDTNRITFSANLNNDENRGYIINIQVNSIKRVSDLLSNKGMDEIEGIIGHELTHLFKMIQGEYQKTGIDLFDKKKNSINHKKYILKKLLNHWKEDLDGKI